MPATSMSPISASFAVSSLLHCHRRTVRYAASHRCGSSRSDRGVLRAPRLACDHSPFWTGYVPPLTLGPAHQRQELLWRAGRGALRSQKQG